MTIMQRTRENRPETHAMARVVWVLIVENCDWYFSLFLTSTGGFLGGLWLESKFYSHGAHWDVGDATDKARVRATRAAVAVATIELVVRPLTAHKKMQE